MSDPGPAAYLAEGAIAALFAAPTLVLGIVACFRARRHGDPARVAVSWLKAVFSFAFFAFGFLAVSLILQGVVAILSEDSGYYISFDTYRVANTLSIICRVCFRFADITLMVTCAELGIGFMYALEGVGKRSSHQKTIRIAILVAIIPLIALVLAEAGLSGSLWTLYYNALADTSSDDYNNLSSIIRQINEVSKISLAFSVISLIISIALLVQASMVKQKFSQMETARGATAIYVVITVLSLPRLAWDVASASLSLASAEAGSSYIPPVVSIAVEVIFTLCILFITLVLLFVIGTRKHNGLWTTLQPWMNGVAPTMIPRQQVVWHGQQQEQYPPPGMVAYHAPPPQYYPQQPPQQPPQYGWQPNNPQEMASNVQPQAPTELYQPQAPIELYQPQAPTELHGWPPK